jgi:hypothetical protein
MEDLADMNASLQITKGDKPKVVKNEEIKKTNTSTLNSGNTSHRSSSAE